MKGKYKVKLFKLGHLGYQMEALIVTGANSGIGLVTTKLVSSKGITVLAFVRRTETFSVFDNMDHVKPFHVDVNSEQTIITAREEIKKSGFKIIGLVNNAGIALSYPLIDVPESEIREVFEVNIYGLHRMTQIFIDDLIESKGRIVNISSISGILSGFASGAYSMSKHAVEAYSDSLAKELRKFEIHVAIVEPGNYQSNIGLAMLQRIKENMNTLTGNHYAEEFQKLQESREDNQNESDSPEPIAVAEAIYHAITSENPKTRYLVTDNQQETDMTMNRIILEMLQLNQDHPFNYGKQELLDRISKMYDEDLQQLQLNT